MSSDEKKRFVFFCIDFGFDNAIYVAVAFKSSIVKPVE